MSAENSLSEEFLVAIIDDQTDHNSSVAVDIPMHTFKDNSNLESSSSSSSTTTTITTTDTANHFIMNSFSTLTIPSDTSAPHESTSNSDNITPVDVHPNSSPDPANSFVYISSGSSNTTVGHTSSSDKSSSSSSSVSGSPVRNAPQISSSSSPSVETPSLLGTPNSTTPSTPPPSYLMAAADTTPAILSSAAPRYSSPTVSLVGRFVAATTTTTPQATPSPPRTRPPTYQASARAYAGVAATAAANTTTTQGLLTLRCERHPWVGGRPLPLRRGQGRGQLIFGLPVSIRQRGEHFRRGRGRNGRRRRQSALVDPLIILYCLVLVSFIVFFIVWLTQGSLVASAAAASTVSGANSSSFSNQTETLVLEQQQKKEFRGDQQQQQMNSSKITTGTLDVPKMTAFQRLALLWATAFLLASLAYLLARLLKTYQRFAAARRRLNTFRHAHAPPRHDYCLQCGRGYARPEVLYGQETEAERRQAVAEYHHAHMRGHLEEEWQKLGAGMLFGLHHSRRISCFLSTLRDLAISALLLALIFAASYASVSISSVADPLAHFFNGSLADHHNSSNATSTASVEFMM